MSKSSPPVSKKMLISGMAALALGVALLVFWSTASQSPAAAPPSGQASGRQVGAETGGSSASETGAAPAPEGPATPEDLPPMPGCWQGIHQLDQNLSLGNFRAALSAALARNDQILMSYLEERLTGLIGDNPQNALQVLSWAEEDAQTGLTLVVYMEAIKKAPAVHNPKVSERLLQIGEDPKGPLPLRAAAMVGLETQKRLEPATLGRLKAIAVDEKVDAQIAWNATRTLGRVMEADFNRTGAYQPYWEQLLEINQKSDEPGVRLLALEMPSYASPILDGESIDTLTKVMKTDRDRLMREMAALRLSHTDEPERALEAYRQAFATEHDLCVRWALLRFSVRVAGAAALPQVEQFARLDPRFQQDYLDFKEMYAKGMTDWERVFTAKKEYHECIAEEGAPH